MRDAGLWVGTCVVCVRKCRSVNATQPSSRVQQSAVESLEALPSTVEINKGVMRVIRVIRARKVLKARARARGHIPHSVTLIRVIKVISPVCPPIDTQARATALA